jgi:hypothetical protein
MCHNFFYLWQMGVSGGGIEEPGQCSGFTVGRDSDEGWSS